MQAVFSRIIDPPSVSLASFPLFGGNKRYTRKQIYSLSLEIIKQWVYLYPWHQLYNEGECVTKHPQQRKQRYKDTACTIVRYFITGFFDTKLILFLLYLSAAKEKQNKDFYESHKIVFTQPDGVGGWRGSAHMLTTTGQNLIVMVLLSNNDIKMKLV